MEVILAMGILAIALVAVLQIIVGMSLNTSLSRHRVEAIQHAEDILNQMRLLRDSGAEVPGGIVSQFPAGTFEFQTPTLPQERASISYVNPAATPLEVTVKIQWVDIRGRAMTESLSTALERL